MTTDTLQITPDLLSLIHSDAVFQPRIPASIKETGLNAIYIEGLLLKHLATTATSTGRMLSQNACLPFGMITEIMNSLRRRQMVVHSTGNSFNDYEYALTEG